MRLISLAALVAAPVFAQQVYSWEDKDGIHYTDDPSQIPRGTKVASEKLAASPKSSAPQAVAPAATVPVAARSDSSVPAAHDERQWRDRFIEAYRRVETLKRNIAAMESTIPTAQTCTTSMRPVATGTPGSVVGTTGGSVQPVQQCFPNQARDRMLLELAQKRVELKDAELDIDRLEREATMAQVPREWRRGW